MHQRFSMRDGKPFPPLLTNNGFENIGVPTVRNVDARPGKGWPEPEVNRNLNDDLFEGHPIGDFQLDAEPEGAIVAFLRTLTDRSLYGQPIQNRK